MNHVLTAVILCAALVMYGLGYSGYGSFLLVVGLFLELWFWLRFFAHRR